jgi:hypothetical protein
MGNLVVQTVRVPQELWRRAKHAAADIPGGTMQQLLAEGLELRLKQLDSQSAKKPQSRTEAARG